MKHTRVLTFVILIVSLLNLVPTAFAAGTENPALYLTFETLEGGRLNNYMPNFCDISLNNVKAYNDGYRGVAAEIGSYGAVNIANGQLGKMLENTSGMSFSAYIKTTENSGTNLLTVYSYGNEKGISISLSGSKLKAYARTDKNETLKGAEYQIDKPLNNWTHVLVSMDFINGSVKFFIDGEFKKSQSVNFMGNKFLFDGAAQNDIIGDSEMYLDELRVHNYAVTCSEPAEIIKGDEAEPSELPYVDILADNLVAGFSFDEGEGDVTKSHGKVEVEALMQNTEWDEGVRGTALRFHPSERSMVTIGNDVLNGLVGADGFTVSGWLYVNDKPNVTYRIMSLNIAGTKAAMHLSYSADTFQLATRSCPTDALQGRSYIWSEVGKWLFVTVTADFNANTVKFFVNGQELESVQGTDVTTYSQKTFSCADAQPSTIGGDPTTPTYNMTFAGMLDEWNIYNRSISSEEARYVYIDYGTVAPREKDSANYAIMDSLSKNTAVFAVEANEAFYKGKRHRMDWDNINAAPYFCNDTVMIPLDFITEVYGAKLDWTDDNNGELIYANTKISFELESNIYKVNGIDNILDVTPQLVDGTYYLPLRFVFETFGQYVYYEDGVIAVGDKTSITNTFKRAEYAGWAKLALCELPYIQQTANHPATRVEIAHSDVGVTSNLCYASPSITKLPDGALIVYHDAYVYGGASHGGFIYRSDDNGATWKHIADVDTMMASIFELNGDLYIMGVLRGNPTVTLQKSTDGGYTWTYPADNTTGLITNSKVTQAHCGPTPVVISNGRIYRAYENVIGSGFSNYCAFMLSADINSNLLDADSWTFTDPVKLNVADVPEGVSTQGPGWLEGNAVIGPDGGIYNIIRVNFEPDFGYAGILKLSDDNTKLTFEKFVEFDGGMTKFVVRRDEQTGKYISLVNNITNIDYSKQRTVLSMSVSADLENWRLAETLLYPNELENWENIILTRAFQYVDWIIDGDDILYVVREAGEGAPNYHDANMITFYRIKNFRQYL